MKKINTEKEKKKIENQISALREKLNIIVERQASEANSKIFRKCFKYRNCYSCPDGPQDYWWLYGKVIHFEGSTVTMFTFQTDKDGKMECETRARLSPTLSSWKEIKEDEFDAAYSIFKKKIQEKP